MDPCVKFGTTGTAFTVTADRSTATALVTIDVIVFPEWIFTRILHLVDNGNLGNKLAGRCGSSSTSCNANDIR